MTNDERQHMMLQMHDARVVAMRDKIVMREFTMQRYGGWVPQAMQDAENIKKQALKNPREALDSAFEKNLKL